jgi:limonene-1,2-epoxide hydrolase
VQVAWSVGIFARMRPKQVVQAWVEAFNRGNADEIAGFYTENAVNHQVVNEPVEGRAAIHAMFKREFGAAKMVCQIENLFEDGDWVILEWRDPLGLRGCGVFRIEAAKIVFQRGYWDRLSFSKVHGMPINSDD